ncbi:MAG TPA: hypothetical protein VF469_09300 [Kofleriaceae bacterium]
MKFGSLVLAGALGSCGAAAQAQNINTSALVCQNYQSGARENIYYREDGAGVFRFDNDTSDIVCPIPRSPLSAGATPTFFVDGLNVVGTSTRCTLTIITPTNQGGPPPVSFTEDGGTGPTSRIWRHTVTFPPDSVGPSDYASLRCTLPTGFNGTIRGVTSVQ